MAIFDSTKRQILTYYIHLTDRDLVAQYQERWPDGINFAPTRAAAPSFFGSTGAAEYFDAPWRGYTEPAAGEAPFTWTPNGKDDQDRPFPLYAANFSRTTGGFWGIGGSTVEWSWMGKFILAQDGAADEDLTAEEGLPGTCRRFWVEGFEGAISGLSTVATGSGLHISPDAGRHPGGMGLAIRSSAASLTYSVATHLSVAASVPTWERFYLRARAFPTTTTNFYYMTKSGGTSGAGFQLGLTATGQLAVYTKASTAGTPALVATYDIGLEEWNGLADHQVWKKIDLIHTIGALPASSATEIRVNGALVATVSYTGGTAGTNKHNSSILGGVEGAANDLEVDIDDWTCAEWLDDNAANRLAYSKEFKGGSKIVFSRSTAFGADHGAWVGDYRVTAQNPGASTTLTPLQALTSVTSGAIAEIVADAEYRCDADAQAIGVGGMRVQLLATRGSSNGSIGYSLAGAAPVTAALTESGTLNQHMLMYSPQTAKTVDPQFPPITPLNLRYVKGADVSSASLYHLAAHVELIGKFGPEDYTAAELAGIDTDAMASTGTHNFPYPTSPWARRGAAAPVSPYITWGGTYVGNGTGQDISFRAPVHWLYVRPLTGSTGGYFWTSAMLGAHKSTQEAISPQIVDIGENTAYAGVTGAEAGQQQEYRLRLVGNESQINQTGITYQYIAISDPGMRYMLNGCFANGAASPDTVHPLVNPEFTPEFLFLYGESVSNTSTVRFYSKSAGQAAASIVSSAGTVVASAFEMAEGSVTSKTALHALSPRHWAYSGFRKQDGNNDTGEARVVAFGTYTGDGTASRSINLAPAANRRPMFAMVWSEAATGIVRDPSHTGTASSTLAGAANASTGITAGGIDSFTVGSALNTNAVVYSYFVLYGSESCTSSGGWGCNAENTPVEPTSPDQNGPFPTMPPEPVEFDPDDEDDGDGDGDGGGSWAGGPPTTPVDFSTACFEWSTYMVNLALSRIGISKQITDIRTDASEEAYKGRLVYALDVEQVLRDFPWPFATRYSNLTLVGGTASAGVNQDWLYSYRVPTDFLFARRIVGPDMQKRAWDADPQQFRIGSDSTGLLIYSNEPATTARPLQLEYTIRMSCPAQQGDAIFRSALVWKLASSLALTIAKDNRKAAECEAMYRETITQAKETAADEQQHDTIGGDPPWISGR